MNTKLPTRKPSNFALASIPTAGIHSDHLLLSRGTGGPRMGLLRELYRRFRIACHKPGHWQLRPDTFDRRIFRNVIVENEYRLPSRFEPTDVILDVGGHIGTFSHAVLARGAGQVYCCEPDADNFRVLCHNLAPYGARAQVMRCAVCAPTSASNRSRCTIPGGPTTPAACK